MGEQDNSGDAGAVKARLKWFNGPKGFGFVVPDDNQDEDAFLHVTTLQRAGFKALGEGACLLCHIERGEKGAQVREVLDVLDGGAPAEVPVARSSGKTEIVEVEGVVKWYRPQKGFGFVAADDGGKDIFIHKTALEAAGMDGIEPGVRLSMKVKLIPKGREVVAFTVLEG